MRETRRDLDLAREPLASDDLRNLRVQRLERDLPTVLRVIREIHGRHSSAADLPHDTIPAADERRCRLRRLVEQRRIGDRGGL